MIALLVSMGFLALLAIRMPVAFSLAISGAVGITLLRGWGVAGNTLATLAYVTTARQGLVIVPLFILLGAFAFRAGIASDVYALIQAYTQRFKSAVALSTIFACAAFAAVTGSSVATVAALGPNAVTEMRRYGYSTRFAAGLVSAAGTLGILIPPSVALVLYGIITGERIGALLLAGVVPGIVSALGYAAAVPVMARFPFANAPPAARPGGDAPAPIAGAAPHVRTWGRAPRSTYVGAVMAAVIVATIVGGIFFGVFTTTESAAVGALVAALMLTMRSLRGGLRSGLRQFGSALRETASSTGMVFAILVGGSIFTYFLVSAGVPRVVSGAMAGLDVHPMLVVALVLLLMVPLGMVLDGLSLLVIVVPFAYPVVVGELGFDGLWFGVMVIKMIEVGLVTPPVGLNAYVISGLVPDLTVADAFRGLMPFYVIDLAVIAVLFLFPWLTTVLPSVMLS
jgi:tripartite ATP-independent transporter DctM subunit